MSLPKIPKVHINAEFQRLIWLNFSLPLLCMMLFCYAFFAYNSVVDFGSYNFEELQDIGLVGFWLSNLAMVLILQRSFSQDMSSQFWDQLRMSTLTAWQLSWTRLFITPILAWFSIGICMVLVFAGTVLYTPSEYVYTTLSDHSERHIILTTLMLPMLSIMLGSSLIINELQEGRSSHEWNGSYIQIGLLIFVGMTFLRHTFERFDYSSHFGMIAVFDNHFEDNVWHLFCYAILFSVIALYSLYKSMSYKLHLKSSHLYWLGLALALPFVCVLIDSIFIPEYVKEQLYQSPDDLSPTELQHSKYSLLMYYFSAYMVLIYSTACGISLICQDNRTERFKLSLQYFKAKNWQKLFNTLPIWVIMLPITLVMLGVLSIVIPMLDKDFFGTIIHQNNTYYVFSFMTLGLQLLIYMVTIFALSRLSAKIAPRFNSVSLSLIGFIILYLMWQILSKV